MNVGAGTSAYHSMRLVPSCTARLAYCTVLLSFVMLGTAIAAPQPQNSSTIGVYESSEALHESLAAKPTLKFGKASGAPIAIVVDDSHIYQPIEGFGASLTDASAWLLAEKLSPAARRQLLRDLFDTKSGLGLTILRQPMASSDFSRTDYSYDDRPAGATDPTLAHFSIAPDRRYILPMLREALSVNPKLKVIASPWSPPGWMKTSGSMTGGTLLSSSFEPLANYFVRFVRDYQSEGVPVFAITPQNEPRNIPKDYPGMGMTPEEQAIFIRDHLGPAFRSARLKTKILIFDHNWDMMDFPSAILRDRQAAQFVAGTATHCYGGIPEAQTTFHKEFPEQPIWLTECSGGNWQKGNLLIQQVGLVIHSTRNWARSVVLWNLVLDQNYGPHLGGCTDCRAVILLDHSTNPPTITRTVDFTALAHVSEFVRSGAVRIDSTSSTESALEHVAFRNPDGSCVLLVLNPAGTPQTFNISWHNAQAAYTLPATSVATFEWRVKTKRK